MSAPGLPRGKEIKSVPYAPMSHLFVERLIGTIRREYLGHMLIWHSIDLYRKLETFRHYYNGARVHRSLSGTTPAICAGCSSASTAHRARYAWKRRSDGLFETPVAA